MVILETVRAQARILTRGAELCSLYNKETGTEYIWQADPRIWSRHSPVLFPIVGTLKSGIYHYQGKDYCLPRHGFARDCDFAIVSRDRQEAVFVLKSTMAMREQYPFHFMLKIRYRLTGRGLSVRYSVENEGTADMYFSIGAHPAFNIPLEPSLSFSDYRIDIRAKTTYPLSRHLIDENGLQNGQSAPVIRSAEERLQLSPELFRKDGLIFKSFDSAVLTISAADHPLQLCLEYTGFPYLGIWSPPGAPFVCLEPWCGITDHRDSTGRLEEKEGIIRLAAGAIWEAAWQVYMG